MQRYQTQHSLHQNAGVKMIGVKYQVLGLICRIFLVFATDLDDYEILDIPEDFWIDSDSFRNEMSSVRRLDLEVFDRSVNLLLYPNYKILSPFATIVKITEDSEEDLSDFDDQFCHFLHTDGDSVASINACDLNKINGIVFLNDTTLEIQPVTPQMKDFLGPSQLRSLNNPHIVKRSTWDTKNFPGDFLDDLNLKVDARKPRTIPEPEDQNSNSTRKFGTQEINVEIAVFFDEAAYKKFSPYFDHNDDKLRDMILGYINAVQALYHHKSLGRKIDLTIVYLEIMKGQTMPHANGERSELLDSFCDYQKGLNPSSDKSPGHWDLALYISALDFFAWEDNGRKSPTTMGLATVGGVCLPEYSCLIAEFGAVNIFGRPYPSSGFTAVYILAHEIGHSLGMHHDSTENSCSKEGYIMSPSRGTEGETIWSSCSSEAVQNIEWAKCLFDKPTAQSYDPWKYQGYPGIVYTAKIQCEILLTDKDAFPFTGNGIRSICQNLHCRSPHRSGYYFSGPALQGTECGNNMWCEGGGCVARKILSDAPKPIIGGWSPWKKSKCKSSCITDSKGYQLRRRECNNPAPVNTDQGCEGPAHGVFLCDDRKLCKKRQSIVEHASERCREFSQKLPALDARGLQAPYESARLWMSCAIFCRRRDSGTYYTPRIELNDLGLSSYFPDGTWCHKDDLGENYYCQQNHCLPESFKVTKGVFPYSHDIPGNAFDNIDKEIINYFSLDFYGRPISNSLDKFVIGEQLTDHDSPEVPESIRFNGPVHN